MIFVHGDGTINKFLMDLVFPTAFYFKYQMRPAAFMSCWRPHYFSSTMAIIYRKEVKLYHSINNRKGFFISGFRRTHYKKPSGANDKVKSFETIPIVSEFDTAFPDKVAVRTSNVEFVRELIANGISVTWLDFDWHNLAKYVGTLNVENFFVDLNDYKTVVLPSGETTNNDGFYKGGMPVKYESLLGLSRRKLNYFLDIRKFNNWNERKRKGVYKKSSVPSFVYVGCYNYLSLRYLEWQKKKFYATNVKTKPVKGVC